MKRFLKSRLSDWLLVAGLASFTVLDAIRGDAISSAVMGVLTGATLAASWARDKDLREQ